MPAKKLSPRAAQWRKGLLAKIHLGKKALGMDDGDYRALLEGRYEVESAGKLSITQLEDLVAWFEGLNVTFTNPGRKADQKSKDFIELPDGTHYARQKRWIAAMWNACGWKMNGLDARSKKQFGVDKFIWIKDQSQLQTLAKDLQNRCRSKGLDPENL